MTLDLSYYLSICMPASSPSPCGHRQVHISVGMPPVGFWCVRNVDMPALWRFNELYLLVVLLVAPTAVMATAYTCIVIEVWRVMKKRQHMTNQVPTRCVKRRPAR